MGTKIVHNLKTTNLLKDFVKLNPRKYNTIKPNDFIKYFSNGELKYGGFVRQYEPLKKYVVLANYNLKVTWCVQLADPSVVVYIKTKKVFDDIKSDKDRVYELYKAGVIK